MGYLGDDARDIESIRRQMWRNSVEWFPKVHSRSPGQFLIHSALGLAGETGEAVDVIKKWHRDSDDLADLDTDKLGAELADVMIYLLHICTVTGINIADEVGKKTIINRKRFGS